MNKVSGRVVATQGANKKPAKLWLCYRRRRLFSAVGDTDLGPKFSGPMSGKAAHRRRKEEDRPEAAF